jgi:hypothetical protein
MTAAKKSARQHARERGALDGADAQALEGALAMTERERDEWRRQHENALASWQADLRALKAKQDAGLASLATRLDLFLPADFDPYYAIGLDIGRLQGVERLWSQACEIARAHCPVSDGLSHIREGIPALAKRALDAERQRDEALAALNTCDPPHDGGRVLRPHSVRGWWQVWSGGICVCLLRPDDFRAAGILSPMIEAAAEAAYDAIAGGYDMNAPTDDDAADADDP